MQSMEPSLHPQSMTGKYMDCTKGSMECFFVLSHLAKFSILRHNPV